MVNFRYAKSQHHMVYLKLNCKKCLVLYKAQLNGIKNLALHDIDFITSDTLLFILQVAFVDYGNTAWISEVNVRHLHPKFIHLPIQAVECTLDGLKVNEDVDFNWAV